MSGDESLDCWWVTLEANGREFVLDYYTPVRQAAAVEPPTREDVLTDLIHVEANGKANLGLWEFVYGKDRPLPTGPEEVKSRIRSWRRLRTRKRKLRRLFPEIIK